MLLTADSALWRGGARGGVVVGVGGEGNGGTVKERGSGTLRESARGRVQHPETDVYVIHCIILYHYSAIQNTNVFIYNISRIREREGRDGEDIRSAWREGARERGRR